MKLLREKLCHNNIRLGNFPALLHCLKVINGGENGEREILLHLHRATAMADPRLEASLKTLYKFKSSVPIGDYNTESSIRGRLPNTPPPLRE